jgi:hypothetical protein
MFLTQAPITEERRRPEAESLAAFEAQRPGILGALLDAVVVEGLRRPPWPSRCAPWSIARTGRQYVSGRGWGMSQARAPVTPS